MYTKVHFTKNYFEQELPRLQKLVECYGRPLSVVLTLEEGLRVELRDFQLTPTHLLMQAGSDTYPIPFQTIQGIQFVPQKKKHLVLSTPKPVEAASFN